jgi:hypothetical protein
MYKITSYSFKKAKKLNLKIYPSSNSKYKIDVFDSDDNYITSIGASGYSDYSTYVITHGLKYANERRKLYKQRHSKDRHVYFSRGWLADNILW